MEENLNIKETWSVIQHTKDKINDLAEGLDPWEVVFYTSGGCLLLYIIKSQILPPEHFEVSLSKRTMQTFWKYIKMLPPVKKKVDEAVNETIGGLKVSLKKDIDGIAAFNHCLPKTGLTPEQIREQLDIFCNKVDDNKWNTGKLSGAIYNPNSESYNQLLADAFKMFLWSNPLHFEMFPSVAHMESEVVSMCIDMFHGGKDACGTMTSGGTESILLACRTYRNWGYEKGIKRPNIIIPITAHAAFDKAGEYFKIKIVHAPIDPVTQQVNISAVSSLIDGNTVAIVGSAPNFPSGIMDPIEELSALALSKGINLHVDSCLGGFLVPFMKEAGFELPLFDFELDGVTSISLDTHKYGYSPKGSSVVLYSKKELRHFQVFVQEDWTGGIYATPSIAGSRSGATIAGTWTSLVYYGRDGYVNATRQIVSDAMAIKEGIKKIDGLKLVGDPKISVVAFDSDKFDIFRVFTEMNSRGWHLNALQYPSCVHICVTLFHDAHNTVPTFLQDLKECVKIVAADPNQAVSGAGAIYGTSQAVTDRSIIAKITKNVFDLVYEVKEK